RLARLTHRTRNVKPALPRFLVAGRLALDVSIRDLVDRAHENLVDGEAQLEHLVLLAPVDRHTHVDLRQVVVECEILRQRGGAEGTLHAYRRQHGTALHQPDTRGHELPDL